MNAKIILLLITPLLSGLVRAEEGDNAALAQLAREKMAAAIRLDARVSENQVKPFCGAFISKDGLALINLSSLVWKEKPTAVTVGGTPLKLGRILGLFPAADLALMKFECHPKTWMEFAENELEVGDTAAVVVTESLDKAGLDGNIPPVIGKILAKRSAAGGDYRNRQFTKVLSLGSGMTINQCLHLAGGSMVIDSDGHLVALFSSEIMRNGQSLLELTPVVELADLIREMVEKDKDIPFPLSEANNPMDPVKQDKAYYAMTSARSLGNLAESRRILKDLLARYPTNMFLKDTALVTGAYYDPDDPLVTLADFPVCDPGDSVANQVRTFYCRAFLLFAMGDTEKALEARRFAIELSPKDEPVCRHFLARAYANLERFDEAETLMREAYPYYSDSIEFVELFERILIKVGKMEEADKMADRVFELSEIYRR